MKRARSLVAVVVLVLGSLSSAQTAVGRDAAIEARVEALLGKMTLAEKVGQLNQYSIERKTLDQDIAEGKVGSLIYVTGAEETNRYQRIAVEKSRLHIPILFGFDVVHGYRTIFPIPLAIAGTWDPRAAQEVARISAVEASAAGIRWTYAPMVDIARDPRWGRIAEGAGEDPVLVSRMAEAYIRGFQNKDLSQPDSVAACVKHYVGYGAAEGGRDYNAVDMSEARLREVYLPPFLAAKNANVTSFMSSFNTLNGLPATANPYTLREVLKNEWDFRGFVVSDWNSIGELINHGVAVDKRDAARLAMRAGVDMDMNSGNYIEYLAGLVRDGAVPEAELDDSVRRILRIKFALGLFDHPYIEDKREASVQLTAADRAAARRIAAESLVLLKNEGDVLPLKKTGTKIAVIGPLADDASTMLGNWFAKGQASEVVTILQALRARQAQGDAIVFAPGGEVTKSTARDIAAAVAAANAADQVVMVLGERGDMSGEAASRSDLGLPGDQEKLLETVVATGKPVTVVVISGRPLVLTWAAEHVRALVEAWLPGTEGGNAVADVLFGDVNPSGHLPATMPRSVGQIPIYYSALSTGRPVGNDARYFSGYIDTNNEPLYPFGYGLSYTTFTVSDLKISPATANHGEIKATVEITNTGSRDGSDVIELNSTVPKGELAHPERKLVAFTKVFLKAGETRKVEMIVPRESLMVADRGEKLQVLHGTYRFFLGNEKRAELEASIDIPAPELKTVGAKSSIVTPEKPAPKHTD